MAEKTEDELQKSKEEIVALVLKDQSIVTAEEMDAFTTSNSLPESSQLPEDTFASYYSVEGGLVKPPFNRDFLVKFLDLNTDHYRCSNQKAIDVTAQGWGIRPIGDPESASQENRDILTAFFTNCNPSESVVEVFLKCWVDYEAIGDFYLEVVRDTKTDKPKALYHLPAHTMRVTKNGKIFIQMRGSKKAAFRRFGVSRDEAFDTVTKNLSKEIKGKDAVKPLAKGLKKPLSEVINISNYTPRSSYYGTPDFIPALGAMSGDISAREFTLKFFENHAVPQFAVLVEGGSFNDDAQKVVREYFRKEIKGKPHSTLILQSPKSGVSIKLQELQTEIKDASFRLYRKDNRDETVRAHGLPPFKVGIIEVGNIGAGTGSSQIENYKFSVVKPRQEILEFRINQFLIQQGFGITDWKFKFHELDTADQKLDAEITAIYLKAGVISVNDARKRIDLQPVVGGETPFVLAKDVTYLRDAATQEFENEERALQNREVNRALELLRDEVQRVREGKSK